VTARSCWFWFEHLFWAMVSQSGGANVEQVQAIRIVESQLTNTVRIEVSPPGARHPLVFRVVASARTTDWIVRDPFGATLCRTDTREGGVEVAAARAARILEEAAEVEHVA
jgi:hypothetical protein